MGTLRKDAINRVSTGVCIVIARDEKNRTGSGEWENLCGGRFYVGVNERFTKTHT